MSRSNFLRNLSDDGLVAPFIKRHSLKKTELHNYYAELFTTSMKNRWPQRAYVGLYSGSGRAQVEGTGEIVETSAMSVFRLTQPFTKYIFVDNDQACVDALRDRVAALPTAHDVTFLCDDVQSAVPQIKAAMPQYGPGQGLLSFCFIDPFAANLDFAVIRALAAYRMDFLILLMLGRDVRTNFRRYYEDPADTRIAELVDDPDWRTEWQVEGHGTRHLIRFLLEKFDNAMTRIGYRPSPPEESHPIRVSGKKVFLYSLVFYTKHELGHKFWGATRIGSTPQIDLAL